MRYLKESVREFIGPGILHEFGWELDVDAWSSKLVKELEEHLNTKLDEVHIEAVLPSDAETFSDILAKTYSSGYFHCRDKALNFLQGNEEGKNEGTVGEHE